MEKTTFNQKFVEGAVKHMNEDHRDAMVDILHGLCEATWVTDAEMLHFDKEKMEIRGLGAVDKTENFEVKFDDPLEKANEFRPVLITILKRARELKKQ
ncbi:MAG: DUF2470 domain-containing protein [Bacteroidota bacterium]